MNVITDAPVTPTTTETRALRAPLNSVAFFGTKAFVAEMLFAMGTTRSRAYMMALVPMKMANTH